MALDLGTVRTAVRTECGTPSVDDLPDEAIDQKITASVRRIRQAATRPEDLKLGYIQCVGGQQAYTLPANREIEEVFWGPSGTLDEIVQETFVDQFSNIPGSSLIHPGSIIRRSDLVMQQLQVQTMLELWDWHILDGKLYVSPTPAGQDQRIYYTYWDTVIVVGLPDEWFEAVLYLSTAMCLRVLANRFRGRSVPMRAGGGGLTAYEKSQEFEATADQYERRFERELLSLV
jgi:hypothetical protein